MTDDPKHAVVLLSGGLDSAVVAAMARSDGYELCALTFRYGQRHEIEALSASRVAGALGVGRHEFQTIDLRAFGGSALTDAIDVPKSDQVDDLDQGIPVTYVPARNTIFLSMALAMAESIGSTDIFIGVNAVDYSGYPDCRPAFIEAFERMANLATKVSDEGARFKIHAPLMELTKSEIISEGVRLGVDFALTHSCYDPTAQGLACAHCDSCLLRKQGFAEAGVPDPTAYATS